MQAPRPKPGALERKAKLANSYQELLNEFASNDLKSVGNYTLDRLVGKGSFGKVYLAVHKLTNGSKVVLKSAKKNDANLAREIHHHRQFIHPHIARLYEVIVTENLVWMVLEYCPGNELYNYLLEHGPLPVDKVRKVFAQLVGAVTYVHLQSCVHRDLKLENILFDKNENVKLVDFGLTREYEGKASYLHTFCGTVCYSAPEMIRGEKYAGEKVDVWSLGVILYALLCGELPFDDDDESVMRTNILSQEPKYPQHISDDACRLLKALLSKRPLLRPTLPDLLNHPFLAEHGPAQQAVLKMQPPSPFSTPLEKETLQRMRSAGVNTDAVIEAVTAQRCDAIAGWWALLLAKEERKLRRREQKRKDKELEHRQSRRLSAASSKLDMAAALQVVGENGPLSPSHAKVGDLISPRLRGRSERRSAHYFELNTFDLPRLPEVEQGSTTQEPDLEGPSPPPINPDLVRSTSLSRQQQPNTPPKELGSSLRTDQTDVSRPTQSHPVTTSSVDTGELTPLPQPQSGRQKMRRKPSQAILARWKHWTHWFYDNTRRHRAFNRNVNQSVPYLADKDGNLAGSQFKESAPRPHTGKISSHAIVDVPLKPPARVGSDTPTFHVNAPPPTASAVNPTGSYGLGLMPSGRAGPGLSRIKSSDLCKRQSLSPSPLTPRSGMRRSSNGLLGRNSTSSSVSSTRSIHLHHHSHSKASSISSTGSTSASLPMTPIGRGRSPHHSVKILPATPIVAGGPFLPSGRLMRDRPSPLTILDGGLYANYSPAAPRSPNPFAPVNRGVLFAKRKRNLFKGSLIGGVGSLGGKGADASRSRSPSATGLGRRSGEITIHEENEDYDEDGDGDEEVEEVDAFSPVVGMPGEKVEEHIYDENEAGDEEYFPANEHLHPLAPASTS